MRRSLVWAVIGFGGLLLSADAFAGPARIIILRHGEKKNSTKLCELGVERSQALAKQFLGSDSAQSLFPGESGPAAILAITEHTVETIKPAARTWGLTVQAGSTPPGHSK